MVRCFLSLFCPNVTGNRLTQLVEWCDRYSPIVAQDGTDGIVLDITGCTDLFGGEGPLLLDIHRRLQRMNIESQAAIADSWGVAWALARYGQRFIVHGSDAVSALNPLPVDALRLPEETILELRRLGLTTIAAVQKIPRRSLAVRFGSFLIQRLDQIFYQIKEPVMPWRPPAPYRASRILLDPISTVQDAEYVLRGLLQEVCARLEKNHLGARRLDLACYPADGTVERCEVRTSRPVRSIPHLMRLFSVRLNTMRTNFSLETFVLSILDIETLDPKQLSLSPTDQVDDEDSFDALVDHLGMKFGFNEVNRIRVRESFLPEHVVEFCPASAATKTSAEWPAYRVRPIRLIDPPMSIKVLVHVPGKSPTQFLIGQQNHRIVHSEGPERLTAEWWRDDHTRWGMRDYYRIEDDQGFRFWIFRDTEDNWFLHGHLP